jgi:hypothetical protein
MEKYKVTKSLKDALIRAATDAGSFEQLGKLIEVPRMVLQLVADGQFDEVSSTMLRALMPKIISYLPGNEKKAVIKFLSDHSATRPLGHLATQHQKGQNNG